MLGTVAECIHTKLIINQQYNFESVPDTQQHKLVVHQASPLFEMLMSAKLEER